MTEGDRGGDRNPDLQRVLHQLVEAQIEQTNLMRQLVDVSASLAQSERTESAAELIAAISKARPAETAAPPPQACAAEDADTARMVVLSQYDEMRAALGRSGDRFYARAVGDRDHGVVTITAAQAVACGTTGVTFAKEYVTFTKIGLTELLVGDVPAGVFLERPPIRLWSGERLLAVARYVDVPHSPLTYR